MKISIVTPLYQSASYIEELYRRCIETIKEIGAADYELILVNDGSPDNSLQIAKSLTVRDSRVIVVDLSRNFGQHQATMAGIDISSGDYVFVMDSDLEDEPEWIKLFYDAMNKNGCDVVFGVNNNLKGGFLYSKFRSVFYTMLNYMATLHFPKNACSARLMSRRYVDALAQFKERELFMAGIWHMAGFEQVAVEVVKEQRSPTTYSLARLAGVFVNAITAFSTKPLMLISVFGLCLSLVAFAFTAWVIFQKIAQGIAVEGWASVMAAVLIIGGISLFFNGVMAIYIAKIFIEVKQRPRTLTKDVWRQSPDKER